MLVCRVPVQVRLCPESLPAAHVFANVRTFVVSLVVAKLGTLEYNKT